MYISSEFGGSGGGSSSKTSRCLCSRPFCGMPKTKLSLRFAGCVLGGVVPCSSCSGVNRSSAILNLPFPGYIKGCGKDFGIGSAAAQVPTHRMLHVAKGWLGIAFEEGGTAHHHARGAEAALHGVVLHKGGLHGMHAGVVGKPLG